MAANINNYIAAGNASVENTYASLAAARDNAPKYDELAKEGMKSRAQQKITAMNADADVKRSQIKANAYLKENEIKIDADKKINKSKKKTQFAGKIAAAGAVMASALLPASEIIKPSMRDFSQSESRIKAGMDKLNADIEKLKDGTPTITTPQPSAPQPTDKSSSATPGTLQGNGMHQVSIVDFGNRLQSNFGLSVGEHSSFGGTTDIHAENSHHDFDEAIDVTDWRADNINGVSWQQRTSNLRDMLRGSAHEVLGPGFKGHDTHVHIGAHGGKLNLNQQQYDYFFGGKSGGKDATFTY